MNITTAALALIVTVGALPADKFGAPRPSSARISHCVVSLIDDVQLPAEEAGVLLSLEVTEGKRVAEGDLLARIDDMDAQLRKKAAEADYEAARSQAENDINVRSMEATFKVAVAEARESEDINRRSPGTIPTTQIRREELTAERAKLQIDVAKMEQEVAGWTAKVRYAQVEAADNEIRRRQIDAPIDGVVVQLYKHRGEWVQPGEAIMRIVRMDTLRVEGFVNASSFSPQEVAGAKVKIIVRTSRGRTASVTSEISYVSPIVEASGEFRVWAKVKNEMINNHWRLQPGLSAEMEILLDPARVARSR